MLSLCALRLVNYKTAKILDPYKGGGFIGHDTTTEWRVMTLNLG